MKKGTLKTVEKLLDGSNGNISLNDLYKAFGYNNNSLINVLFLYIDSIIDSNISLKKVNSIYKCIDVLEMIVLGDDINLKLLSKRIDKTVCKIDQLGLENRQGNKKITSICQRLHKIGYRLYNLEENAKKNNNREYVRYLIQEINDLNYLDNILSLYKNSLRIKNYEGGTLIYSIIKEIIDEVLNNKCNKDNLAYYKKMIYVIRNNEYFGLEEKEKNSCLEKIEQVIDILSKEEENIKARKELLVSLRNILSNLAHDENNIKQLTDYYNINYSFDDDLLSSMTKKKIDTKYCGDRVLVDDYVITIDSKDAYEIDDGLSIKKLKNDNYLLGVHIASPLAYFDYSSKVIEEAIKRANTIYFDKPMKIDYSKEVNIIPIMPLDYTLNNMSLNPNNYVFAKTFYFELDKDANVVSQKYCKSIVKTNKKCTFKDINKIDGSTDERLKRTVSLLMEVADKIGQKSSCEDIYLDIKSSSYNPSRTKVGNTTGERIVNNLMVFTGNNVANYFHDNGYPLLYRTHSVNNVELDDLEEKLKNLGNYHDKEKFNKLYRSLIDTYPKAQYDISGGHDGLGLDHYCHCTSPLRRAADIVVEHCLNTCYFNKPSDKDVYNLEKEIINARDTINNKSHDINGYLTEIDKQYSKKKV